MNFINCGHDNNYGMNFLTADRREMAPQRRDPFLAFLSVLRSAV